MTSYNDITGDALVSKSNTEKYRSEYDRIFGSKTKCTECDRGADVIKPVICKECRGEG
jgi:hypothetical protein